MHGKGFFHYSNGDNYIGELNMGFNEGRGTYIWKNGDMYNGEWKQDKQHGIGVMASVNQMQLWKDGVPQDLSKVEESLARPELDSENPTGVS